MGSIKTLLGLILYKIAPQKKNRYVFTSFNGHYSDNTKYISIKLHEKYPKAEIIWLILPQYNIDVPDYVKVVDYKSIKSFWYRGTAKAQFDNVYGFRANFLFDNKLSTKIRIKMFEWLGNKNKQPIFATMHGTSFKRIGRAQIGNNVLGFSCPNTYLIVGDRFTEKTLKYITFEQCKMKTIGWPRNDILFRDELLKVRDKLELPHDKRIILFAPTFRNDGADTEGKNVERSGINQLNEINFDILFSTLSSKFGGDWIMVCRFHYHVQNLVNWEELGKKYPGKFINGNAYDDMALYLSCADILMTDLSSCMFDFANTGKPCFLYFPDLTNYRDNERGFFYDIKTLPFPLASDFETLVLNIKEFDEVTYKQKAKELLNKIESQDDGKASERFIDYVMEICKNDKEINKEME